MAEARQQALVNQVSAELDEVIQSGSAPTHTNVNSEVQNQGEVLVERRNHVEVTEEQPSLKQEQQLLAELADATQEGDWVMEGRLKEMFVELQRHWLVEFQQSREKLLVDLTEKLHQEFLADQQKIRTELLTQFKDELDATRQELEQKYRDTLKQELQKAAEKHRKEASNVKKKQWCWQCDQEAVYHCCWNTAYCSVECQQGHWPTHRKYCRRKKGSQASAGAPTPSAAN